MLCKQIKHWAWTDFQIHSIQIQFQFIEVPIWIKSFIQIKSKSKYAKIFLMQITSKSKSGQNFFIQIKSKPKPGQFLFIQIKSKFKSQPDLNLDLDLQIKPRFEPNLVTPRPKFSKK